MHCWNAVSYRRCASQPYAISAFEPLAPPSRNPDPAPMAAPAPGLPATAPKAAPRPAPTSVPIPAPIAVFWVTGVPGGAPNCCAAHCRQAASSAWNCSKGFPADGSTITLGPVGTVAHPPTSNTPTPINAKKGNVLRMISPVLPPIGQAGQPATRPSSIRWDTGEHRGSIPADSGSNASIATPRAPARAEHRPEAAERPREGRTNRDRDTPDPTIQAPTTASATNNPARRRLEGRNTPGPARAHPQIVG